jgi:hypothetical protein
MDFSDRIVGAEILVELKYCERCGGIWLRTKGADGAYCSGCRVLLEARRRPLVTTCEGGHYRERLRQTNILGKDSPSTAPIDCLQGVAAISELRT